MFVELAAPSHASQHSQLNKSLSFLDQCLRAENGRNQALYRNSKLTKLLKRYVQNGLIDLVVCVAQGPAEKYPKTLATLQLASRV